MNEKRFYFILLIFLIVLMPAGYSLSRVLYVIPEGIKEKIK